MFPRPHVEQKATSAVELSGRLAAGMRSRSRGCADALRSVWLPLLRAVPPRAHTRVEAPQPGTPTPASAIGATGALAGGEGAPWAAYARGAGGSGHPTPASAMRFAHPRELGVLPGCSPAATPCDPASAS